MVRRFVVRVGVGDCVGVVVTVPVDTLAATVREGFASGRSIFAKDAADEALIELVARATQAEADRDMHLRARDSALRTINQLAENSTRMEVEAARLREERDACERQYQSLHDRLVAQMERAEAAEARCARLQQALRAYEVAFSQWDAQGGIYLGPPAARQWRSIAREALAGPDTPADSQPEETTT